MLREIQEKIILKEKKMEFKEEFSHFLYDQAHDFRLK